MTTAFELGCLSAMEKVAVNSGAKDPTGNRRTSAENRTSRELRGLIPPAQPEAQKPVQDLSYTPIGPAGVAASRATTDPKLNAVTIPPNSLFPVSPEARAELERQAAMVAGRQGQNNLLPYVPGTGKADDGFFSGIGSGLYNAAMGTGNFIGNAANTAYNVASEVPSVAGGYLKQLNDLGGAIGDKIPVTNFEGSRLGAQQYARAIAARDKARAETPPVAAPIVRKSNPNDIARNKKDYGFPGQGKHSIVSKNNEMYGKPQSPEQRAAQKALEATEPDVNAQYYENLAKLEAAQNAAKAAPESTSESTPEPTSEPQAQGGLASYLKNPYVLGGLGIGALGLGGYGLYNHFNSKKKKKKKSDSE